MKPEEILNTIYDAHFIIMIGMLDPSNTIWRKQCEEEIMKENWCTAAEMTKRMHANSAKDQGRR